MKKILIVDDDLNFVKNIFNYINNSTGNKFIVSNISINGEEAYKNLITNSFDIMILDLKMPKLNGLELINKIKDIKNFPEIIIITGDPYLMQELVRLNIPISEILTKPFDFDKLIDKLNIIEEKIKNNDFITKISELLNNFYFNKSSPGYLYIVECIKICLNKNSLITPFEKELYKIIANENNAKSNLHVKWAIDKSISTMNKYTTPSVLNDFFPYSRPTSKIFITEMFNIINFPGASPQTSRKDVCLSSRAGYSPQQTKLRNVCLVCYDASVGELNPKRLNNNKIMPNKLS